MHPALQHLQKDPVMAQLIEQHEPPIWTASTNLYFDVIDSIIGQQLSVKAAATILSRFLDLFPTKPVPTPTEILAVSDEDMRAAGLSYAKIKYVKGVAQTVIDNQTDFESLRELPDEEVIVELTKLKGVGRWTAEMLLIFSLHRPDVFSIGDLGLRTAVSKLYNVDRENLKAIEEISLTWSPYRSYASRYLWKSLDNTPK